jgi:N-acetyl-anhydromuramyl-L-alanine amidase AmpD
MSAKLPILKWVPSPNFSARTAKIDLIVIHDCQGGYVGSVETFKGSNNGNPVSAHYVLKEDGSEATQMVDLGKKAWHCVNFNSRSIGIEMAGFEANTTAATRASGKDTYSPAELGAAEVMTAYLCHKLSIPVRWASGGVGTGICRHFDLGVSGGGHTDPTRDLTVWNDFLTKVQIAYAAGGFPDVWAPQGGH